MKVGFTGTQSGMTKAQLQVCFYALVEFKDLNDPSNNEFHHGDCIGADYEAANLAFALEYKIIAHPPSNPTKRGYFPHNDVILSEKPYLERDHDIVDVTEVLIAGPKSKMPMLRSGTWATIRYAESKNRKIRYLNR